MYISRGSDQSKKAQPLLNRNHTENKRKSEITWLKLAHLHEFIKQSNNYLRKFPTTI